MNGQTQGYTYLMGRTVTTGTRGMISSPHYLASSAGFSILARGGSAVDACIAANATLCVVYSYLCGLGGDLCAQVWDPSNGVAAINGTGRAGENCTVESYRSKGHDAVPFRGPLSVNTVPGVVSAWAELHGHYGKLDWKELFQPAIYYARNGFGISQKFCDAIIMNTGVIRQFGTTANTYLPWGSPPQPGSLFYQYDLANSLEFIANQGAVGFYQGDLGRRIVQGLQQAGGILTENDFTSHTSDWAIPIRTTYRGLEVCAMPLPTQGITTLMILNLVEGMNMQQIGNGTADYYHLMTEATKLAFADRDEWVGDPTGVQVPYDQLLSKDYASQRRSQIDMRTARPELELQPGIRRREVMVHPRPEARYGMYGSETVYLCAVDSYGQCVSLVQSINSEFGSGFVPEGTGVLLNNRGSTFSLNPNTVNTLAPHRQPYNPMCPVVGCRDDKPTLLTGTRGNDGQPQTETAIVTRIIDFGFNAQEAVEAPRWLYSQGWGEPLKTLKLESRVPDHIVNELTRRGHDVQLAEHLSPKLGQAEVITIDRQTGVQEGGADPRADSNCVSW